MGGQCTPLHPRVAHFQQFLLGNDDFPPFSFFLSETVEELGQEEHSVQPRKVSRGFSTRSAPVVESTSSMKPTFENTPLRMTRGRSSNRSHGSEASTTAKTEEMKGDGEAGVFSEDKSEQRNKHSVRPTSSLIYDEMDLAASRLEGYE